MKGPTAKLMQELGIAVTNAAIAEHYREIISGLLVDEGDDAPEGIVVHRAQTLISTLEDRIRVARAALALAREIGRK